VQDDTTPPGRLRVLDPGEPLVAELGAAEPVNPPTGREDLERRVAADRRVLVLEVDRRPAVVLWVALTRGIPDHLDEVLAPGTAVLDPATADTAVFHSIWNVDAALAGRGAATLLVDLALDHLAGTMPRVTTATTMSPVPGLRDWLAGRGITDEPANGTLDHLAAEYLCARRPDGAVLDPVARLHLGNGARLWRVLPDADRSPRGLERAFGVMANYRYAPEDRAANRAELSMGVTPVGPEVPT
jgi:malonyl-CoA decarboxylase